MAQAFQCNECMHRRLWCYVPAESKVIVVSSLTCISACRQGRRCPFVGHWAACSLYSVRVTTGHISGSTQCPAQRRSWLSFARGPVNFSLLPTWPAFDCPSASLSSCTCAELVVLTCSMVVACLACTTCHACQCCDTLCAAVTAHRTPWPPPQPCCLTGPYMANSSMYEEHYPLPIPGCRSMS